MARARPRRLLVIYQHAPTEGAPGIYRHRTLLAELVRRGWHVDLLATPVNYMRGDKPARYRWRFARRETIDGIHHHWVWSNTGIHRSKRHKALGYVTFAASAVLYGFVRLRRPDVIWASSPPLSVGTVGRILSWRFRRPWVFEVRDLWPESAAALGWLREGSRPYRLLERSARAYATRAAAVIVPTPGLEPMVREHGAREVVVITGVVQDNPPDAQQREMTRTRLGVDDDECLFLYLGAHGPTNGLDLLLDAVAALPPELPARIVMVGDGGDRARIAARVEREQLARITMLEPVPKSEVGPLLAAADVGLHVLKADELYATALPTKMLEYMGAHLPVITTVPGLPAEIAEASGGSVAATAEALAATLGEWTRLAQSDRRARGERSFEYGMQRYGLTASVDRLERVLGEAMGDASGEQP